MTSTYEYPSEQSLLEELPPEPGDFDYIQQLHGKKGHSDDDGDIVDLNPNAGASLRSTPGLGSGGEEKDILFMIVVYLVLYCCNQSEGLSSM